jgi:CheY-like chemotaxis protein
MAKTASSAAPKAPFTILLVDDHPVVRECLTLRIQQEEDLTVCADAGTIRTALHAVERHLPRLVILDMNLPDGHGLELIKEIKARWPKVRTMVFSMNEELLYAERALRAGAAGYVMVRVAGQGHRGHSPGPRRETGAEHRCFAKASLRRDGPEAPGYIPTRNLE